MNDTLPAGLKYDTASFEVKDKNGVTLTPSGGVPSIPNDGTVPVIIKWDFGNFNNSEDRDIVIKFNVTVADVIANQDGAILANNNATLKWRNYGGSTHFASDESGPIALVEPDLQIIKSANVTETDAGSTILYNITLNHSASSNSTAYDVNITDIIPPGLKLISTDPAANSSYANGAFWNFPLLPVGSTKNLSYTVTVNSTVIAGQILQNQANVTWTSTAGPNPDERFGNYTTLDNYNRTTADLVRVKTQGGLIKLPDGSRNVSIGLSVNYTIILDLPRAIALNVWLNDTLPIGLIYDNSTLSVSGATTSVVPPVLVNPLINDGTQISTINISLGSVNNSQDQDVTLKFNGTVADTADNRDGGIIKANNATSRWKDINGTIYQGNDSSGILKLPAISVVKEALLTANYPNENVTFIINVTNIGETILDPIFVSDLLPYGMEHVSDNMSATVIGRYVNGTIAGLLYPGGSIFVEIQAKFNGKSYDGFVNYVNASGKPPVGKDVMDDDNKTLPDIVSSITVVKTADITNPEVMQNVTYTINVTNTGNMIQETVKVTDIMPVEMTYLSSNPPGVVVGNVITWANLGPLGPGNSTYPQVVMRFE